MTQKQWDEVSNYAMKLYKAGTEIAAENGLILVDTKYEFGYVTKGKVYLCDEIHTPDSSRYWLKNSYEKHVIERIEENLSDKIYFNQFRKT